MYDYLRDEDPAEAAGFCSMLLSAIAIGTVVGLLMAAAMIHWLS